MHRFRWSLLAAALAALSIGCGAGDSQVAQTVSPDEAANARRLIVAWLDCEECESGELEAVVKLGSTAVPTLAAVLREGPSPAGRETTRLHLVDSHQRLVAEAARNPAYKVPVSEDEYVRIYMDNYLARYHVRAAQGLAAIGGPDARRALEAAKTYDLRADARRVLEQSLQKVGSR